MSVPVEIQGSDGRMRDATFVLDSGSQVTIIDWDLATIIGLTVDRSEGPSRLLGPTGHDLGYKVRTAGLTLMSRALPAYLLRCHRLYSKAGVDGLIGLDIIRKGELILNIPWGVVRFTWN